LAAIRPEISAEWHPTKNEDLELLSNLVFEPLNQAATWLSDSTSIPSLNLTPLITFPR